MLSCLFLETRMSSVQMSYGTRGRRSHDMSWADGISARPPTEFTQFGRSSGRSVVREHGRLRFKVAGALEVRSSDAVTRWTPSTDGPRGQRRLPPRRLSHGPS